jgi:hypothetical protein
LWDQDKIQAREGVSVGLKLLLQEPSQILKLRVILAHGLEKVEFAATNRPDTHLKVDLIFIRPVRIVVRPLARMRRNLRNQTLMGLKQLFEGINIHHPLIGGHIEAKALVKVGIQLFLALDEEVGVVRAKVEEELSGVLRVLDVHGRLVDSVQNRLATLF